MYLRTVTSVRNICVAIFSIIFIIIILWYVREEYQLKNIEETAKGISSFKDYECCTPLNISLRKNIFFFKNHKTGGTTVSNIIMRVSMKYSLKQLRPVYIRHYEPLSTDILIPGSKTPDNKYNTLFSHLRYTPEIRSYQYPGTVMVTILRHPAALFQSAYNYFKMQNATGLNFEQFVKAPIKPSYLGGRNDHLVYRGYNQMSSDLGFDMKNADNTTAIREFVRKIDQEFDFVIITEYMEASLVLLANLMGWPLKYVVHLRLNSRPTTKDPYVLTEQDKADLIELNRVDASLYNHFLDKFHACVRRYGEQRINEQVFELRKMNQELKDKCVLTQHDANPFETVGYVLKNYFDVECISASTIIF